MIALLRIREIKPRPRVYVSLSLKLPLAIFALTLIDIGDKKKHRFKMRFWKREMKHNGETELRLWLRFDND